MWRARPGISAGIICSFILFLLIGTTAVSLAQSREPSFQKGICFVTWEKERYLSPHSDKSLEKLLHTGAEWVQIVTTYYQEKYNSKEIFPTDKTPSDKSIIHVIKRARALGMKVMLKPHIDLIDESEGLFRGDIGFQNQEDWQEWFVGYLKFILHYAEIAEKAGVELFCVGTELSFASRQAVFWQRDIIPQIRKVYSGKLTYAANWDEYRNIHFWEDLDYVGIDAYFPLTQNRDYEYEEIKNSWIKWADNIEAWQKSINKDIIFTEIGYRSCEAAASRPWEYNLNTGINLNIQEGCYKAALEELSSRNWCMGLYWWYWKPSLYAGGSANRDFTPQNKPAELVLSSYYWGIPLAKLSQ